MFGGALDVYWIYVVGPVAGAQLLAAGLSLLLGPRLKPLTAKLFPRPGLPVGDDDRAAVQAGAMSARELPGGLVRVVEGDITELDGDAIVNAANSQLAGGGGVDGAIHRRGGPEIMRETRGRFPDGCPTGGAVTTGAGDLRARFVIHAVGPRWSGGEDGEDELLASAWRAALAQAVEHDCRSVAVPSISTGIYGFPIDRAARLAMAEVAAALSSLSRSGRLDVTICAFSESDRNAYEKALRVIGAG